MKPDGCSSCGVLPGLFIHKLPSLFGSFPHCPSRPVAIGHVSFVISVACELMWPRSVCQGEEVGSSAAPTHRVLSGRWRKTGSGSKGQVSIFRTYWRRALMDWAGCTCVCVRMWRWGQEVVGGNGSESAASSLADEFLRCFSLTWSRQKWLLFYVRVRKRCACQSSPYVVTRLHRKVWQFLLNGVQVYYCLF